MVTNTALAETQSTFNEAKAEAFAGQMIDALNSASLAEDGVFLMQDIGGSSYLEKTRTCRLLPSSI